MNDDTIAALASAPGGALRGIIRVSGGGTKTVIDRLFQPSDSYRWAEARLPQSHAGTLAIGGLRVPLDVSVQFWPTSRSYTGQMMAEIHTVGSPPLLEAILAALYQGGTRPAEPGEFTLRAFLSGRVDLAQAEAVLGVIDASDRQGLDTALVQLAGGLSGPLTAMRGDLLDLLSDLEAGLDFVEEDIEFISRDDILRRLRAARETTAAFLSQATLRSVSTGRRTVVLAGLPNAGKSTLFNALCDRDAAIVSHHAGTTRDSLSATIAWDGLSAELIDTAGWETAGRGIDAAAQQLRDEHWDRADLVLWCSAVDDDDDRLFATAVNPNTAVLRLATKSDALAADRQMPTGRLSVSVLNSVGLSEVKDAVVQMLSAGIGGEDDRFVGATAARTRGSLEGAVSSLETAIEVARTKSGDELIALEVHEALHHLGTVVGAVYTDDVLDRIFSRFCIGK